MFSYTPNSQRNPRLSKKTVAIVATPCTEYTLVEHTGKVWSWNVLLMSSSYKSSSTLWGIAILLLKFCARFTTRSKPSLLNYKRMRIATYVMGHAHYRIAQNFDGGKVWRNLTNEACQKVWRAKLWRIELGFSSPW